MSGPKRRCDADVAPGLNVCTHHAQKRGIGPYGTGPRGAMRGVKQEVGVAEGVAATTAAAAAVAAEAAAATATAAVAVAAAAAAARVDWKKRNAAEVHHQQQQQQQQREQRQQRRHQISVAVAPRSRQAGRGAAQPASSKFSAVGISYRSPALPPPPSPPLQPLPPPPLPPLSAAAEPAQDNMRPRRQSPRGKVAVVVGPG
jgi:hypothetical protein